ncbi:MAG: 16S rRNA (adenine(1518)-N(6)/adenine(1519)-N(6))-dimethyltransferase RsmA [Chloroflexota bacterium]
MTGLALPPLDIPALLRQHGLRPKKGLGQNFLGDTHALQEIVAAAELNPDDTVLEIGAGVGNLTRYLAIASKLVTAIELDRNLFPILTTVLRPYQNVRLVQGDILDFPPESLMADPGYLVVANIPYYITSAVLRHLLEASLRPQRVVLTVQKEVAERICAGPGKLSLLALSVQVYGVPNVVALIPAGAFYPPPKVDSAVVRIDISPQAAIPAPLLDMFFRLARAGFSQKRKTLRNSLAAGLRLAPVEIETKLSAAGVDPKRRAETLDLPEWRRLAELFHSVDKP